MNMTFYQQQRAEKFRKERQAEHAEHLRQQEIAEENSKAENAALRANYLAGLEAAKAEKQSERDAEIDLELADERRRLQNEWLANNPTQTPKDFTEKAWHLLRENLIEQRKLNNQEAMRNSLLKTGRYAL